MYKTLLKSQKHILYNHNKILIINFLIAVLWAIPMKSTLQVTVFAGNDTSICPHEVLHLPDLNAYISGMVDNGYWFTQGDGIFQPGGNTNVRFSLGTTYIPGTADKANKGFTLLLVSDDPDGAGPMVQVTDSVRITIQSPPPLFCPASLNVSLLDNCQQLITAGMLVHNPQPPIEKYKVTLLDPAGKIIPDNTLRKEHLGKVIKARISHDCAHGSICETDLIVSDKSPPKLHCNPDTILCNASRLPENTGFPFKEYDEIISVGEKKYKVLGIDNCTDAWVEWHDELYQASCQSSFESIIYRTWTAIDDFNNKKSCVQTIHIRKLPLGDVVMPPHFDGYDNKALQCHDTFPLLTNGHPSPVHTGSPEISPCRNIQSTFTDHFFDKCGVGYKLLRSWLIIDWCSTESRMYNQIIVVEDTKAPEFACPPTKKVANDPFQCYASKVKIYVPDPVKDCSGYSIKYSLFDSLGHLLEKTQVPEFSYVPVGKHTILYEITDECGNKGECSSMLIVEDKETPNPVCTESTVIGLGVNGLARLYAESLDEGSFDNCKIVKWEVQKMDADVCGYNQRGPFVDFCCAEAGKKIRVILYITDKFGNENSCMVIVDVQDKLPPQIIPPSDLTVSCRTPVDFDNLSIFGKIALQLSDRKDIVLHDGFNNGVAGKDGIATDNCSVQITYTFSHNIHCGKGYIIRTFTATDPQGNQSTVQQKITIADEVVFGMDDIIWPSDFTDEICADTFLTPDIAGMPEFKNKKCAQPGVSYKDKVFKGVEGACIKIVREWAVIDWCQYDPSTQQPIWTYDQIIKINNTTPPKFQFACIDTTICLYDDHCSHTRYRFTIPVADDCTPLDELDIRWKYFEWSAVSALHEGNSRDIDIHIPPGKHRIELEVKDRCGNKAVCQYQLKVQDCKAPTPVCISSLTTVLMESSSSITLYAEDFNYKSFDNCTPSTDLIFSFSMDTAYKSRVITCEEIPNGISQEILLEIWVTDLEGNQDFCEARVLVQDNHDVCEDTEVMVNISGKVRSRRGHSMEKVMVEMRTPLPEYGASHMTNTDGSFTFEDIPPILDVTLTARKSDDPRQDVSTLDILLIQRHILGQQRFDNIYKFIAADVNGSGTITSADLIAIRRVILGINFSFPNGTPAWKFIDNNQEITPFDLKNLPEIIHLTTDHFDTDHLRFIGIKMGDVDDLPPSSKMDGARDVQVRASMEPIFIRQNRRSDGEVIAFIAGNDEKDIHGFQLELSLPAGSRFEKVESSIPQFTSENYHFSEGKLRISWIGEMNYIGQGMDWFTLHGFFPGTLVLEDGPGSLTPEMYQELTVRPLIMQEWDQILEPYGFDIRVLQNPFSDRCVIEFVNVQPSEFTLEVYTAAGVLVGRNRMGNKISGDQWVLDNSYFPKSGMFFVNIYNDYAKKTIKVYKLDR
ncbi:MAG TPA: dockerin type I domain-containing protein [Saprospiraceae bacterium]|nr:dockerin type I domain-containing protein [Saprospiraceae bacterium]